VTPPAPPLPADQFDTLPPVGPVVPEGGMGKKRNLTPLTKNKVAVSVKTAPEK
jgi:hypothetical protein